MAKQKYLSEQRLLAGYLMQHASVEDVSAFLSKYPCPTNADKTLEIKKGTLSVMRTKSQEKTFDPVKIGNALGILKISKEDVESFLGKPMFEPEPVPEQKSDLSSSEKEGGKEVVKEEHNDVKPSKTERERELEERLRAAQKEITELEGGKEAAKVEEKVEEKKTKAEEKSPEDNVWGIPESTRKNMTPEELVYYKGPAGLEDLKRAKLVEELSAVVKTPLINIILKRWDADPRTRNDLGELYTLLRRWIPKQQLTNELLQDITKMVGQVEMRYRDQIDRSPPPLFMHSQEQEPQQPPIFDQSYNPQPETRRGETITSSPQQEQRGRQIEPRDQRTIRSENTNAYRESANYDERLYNDMQYLMRRNNELEAKLEDAKTHPAGSSAPANQPAIVAAMPTSQSIAGSQQALQPAMQQQSQPLPSQESLQQLERLRDMEKRLEERDKELENVKETNRQRESELDELRTMRRDQELVDKMSMRIDQKLGSYTSEVDRQIDDIASKIEGMKSDLPKGMSVEDTLRLRESGNKRDIELEKLGLQRDRELRTDARKSSFGENFGKLVEKMGTTATNAALKTTGLVEEETGVPHQVQSATPYEKTPELMVFPCPICGANIHAGASTEIVQCPSCEKKFRKAPEGQVIFVPIDEPGTPIQQPQQSERVAMHETAESQHPEAAVDPQTMSQKLHTQFDSEEVGGTEGKGEGEESKAEEEVKAEEKGVEEVKARGKGKGKGKIQKEEEGETEK